MERSFAPDGQELELRDGGIILRFDGTVLEIFAGYAREGGQRLEGNSTRIHIKQLEVATEGPDRKERFHVTFAGPAYGYPFRFEEGEWNEVQPLLDALRTAGVSVKSQ
jgi:hypothetical protein